MEILYFIILIILSGFFSGAEIAFFSLTQAQARHLLDQKRTFAGKVWWLKQRPQRLLITILIGNNIVNVLTASLATVLAVDYFGDAGVGIATGVVTLFILVFGEITPKSLAQKNNAWIALKTSPIFYGLSFLFYPIIWLLIRFNNFVAEKLLKSSTQEKVTEQEIRAMARLGVESGAIEYREREMIENILRFNDTVVGQIMTPRRKMVLLNGEVPIDQIAYFVGQAAHSRYPVYEDDEENILGYIHSHDVMRKLQSDERDQLVKENIRDIEKVPENLSIERLFRQMLKDREHMVLVIRDNDDQDVIGLVTLEDILEELVGEVYDEMDGQ